MNISRDAYQRFFENLVSQEDFFKFGLEEIIFADKVKAKTKWDSLKLNLFSNESVFIRSYGRKGVNSQLYQDLYSNLFGNTHIQIDPTNNQKPRKLIEELTRYMKSPKKGYEPIQNYQVSHVFGRTKNALAFTAPWNIVYLPKLLDPFTGHEAKGKSVAEFTKMFQKKCINEFKDMILEFNEIMESDQVTSKLSQGIDYVVAKNNLDQKQKQQFEKSVYSEFKPIQLEKQ